MPVIEYVSCLFYLSYSKCNTMDNVIAYCDVYIYIHHESVESIYFIDINSISIK